MTYLFPADRAAQFTAGAVQQLSSEPGDIQRKEPGSFAQRDPPKDWAGGASPSVAQAHADAPDSLLAAAGRCHLAAECNSARAGSCFAAS